MHRSMTLASLVILSVSLGSMAAASEAEPAPGPAALDGRYGLVFGFDGHRLTSFDGTMIALRKQMGQRTGLRLGLSLGLNDFEIDQEYVNERETVGTDSTESRVSDSTSENDGLNVEVDLLLIRHGMSAEPIRFFYGAGPMVSYGHRSNNDRTQAWQDGVRSERTTDTTSSSWRYGLRLVAGAEWFLTDAISVHAEYRTGLVYQDHESEYETITEFMSEGEGALIRRQRSFGSMSKRGWDLSDHAARFGVSLFF